MNKAGAAQDPEMLGRAHIVPFGVFMAFLILLQFGGAFIEWKHPDAPWWRQDPAQLVYPIQVIVTAVFLIRCWRFYRFDWSLKWSAAGVLFGVLGIGLWLLPTTLYDHWNLSGETSGILKWLGVAERKEGFDPGIFESAAGFWFSLVMRFIRAAVIVALVEEIFWRGFLMRFVMDWEGNYWKQPFGRAHWKSYAIVTGMFVLAHAPVDYAGALVYGSLTWLLCVWSKNLGACVVMHAVANFLMGCYAMAYGKYGVW
jgi:CAAX prenyl protease-like protein